MIHHAIEQRSQEWFLMRLGKPTASEFHKIVTPKGELSKQASGYMCSLLAELMLGKPLDTPQTEYMLRGTELEDGAIAAYEMVTGCETDRGGFVTTDDGMIGCSPDRLCGKDGILEMKVPAPNTHVSYLLSSEDFRQEKRCQIQGELYVCEREWVDLVSYHPEMPPVIVRCKRDDAYIKTLSTALSEFVDTLLAARVKLETLYGPFPQIAIAQPPPDDDLDGLGFDVTPQDISQMLERGVSTVTEGKR